MARRCFGQRWLIWCLGLCWAASSPAARLEVLKIPGPALAGNPLGDPTARCVALFLPEGHSDREPLPLAIFLPGWGASSEDAIAHGAGDFLGQTVDRLAQAGLPSRIASVDARSRYGGSQYLNSSATGAYADYVTENLQPALLARFPADQAHPSECIIAGHSSGGYGALLLAMRRHGHFHAVVALSPDSDFEATHRRLVEEPSVRAVTARELELAMAVPGRARLPSDGLAALVMGLCANYAPDRARPGRFEWLYDAEGRWRAEVWQRWLAADPYTLIRERPDAFAPTQRIYLDGPLHDAFLANIGARAMYDLLKQRPAPVLFEQPSGGHGDELPERLARGLAWVSGVRLP